MKGPFRQIDRYLFDVLIKPFLPLFAALFLVMLMERALRLIQEFAVVGIDLRYFLPLIAMLAPYYLNLAISAAFAVALIIAIGSLATHREIESLSGMGLPMSRVVRPMLLAGAILACICLLTGGWLEPLGRHGYRVNHAIAISNSRIAAFQPMAIYSPDDRMMLTADQAENGRVGHLFLWAEDRPGAAFVATAQSGTITSNLANGDVRVAMKDGLMLDLGGDRAGRARTTRFGELRVNQPLDLAERTAARGLDQRELTLSELIFEPPPKDLRQQRARAAEIWSKLMRAAIIPLLPLLVLPLLVAGRERRGPAIILVALVMVVMHHGINFAANLGRTGIADPARPMLISLGALLLVIAMAWVAGRKLPGPTPLSLLQRLHLQGRTDGRAGAARFPAVPGRTMASYLSWQIASRTLIALLAMAVILQLVDVIENGDELVERGVGLLGFGRYIALRLPTIALQALPVAALAGPLFAFFSLRDSRELPAMQLSGISAFGIMRMVLPVSAGLAALLFLLAEWAVPASQFQFARWWRQIPAEQQQSAKPEAAHWFRIGGELVRVRGISGDGRELRAIEIYRRNADGTLHSRIRGRIARWDRDRWLIAQAEILTLKPALPARILPLLEWRPPMSPLAARRFFDTIPALSSRDAGDALKLHIPADRGRSYYLTRIQYGYAGPVLPFVMLMLAMGVIFARQEPRAVRRSLFLAGLAGLGFLIVDGCLRILGQMGSMPPFAAAWGATALFLLTGLSWMLRSEQVN